MLANAPHLPIHVTSIRFAPSAVMAITKTDRMTSRTSTVHENHPGAAPTAITETMPTTSRRRSTVGSYIFPKFEV
jgi:hypothetical protein